MRFAISESDFVSTFGASNSKYYSDFVRKFCSEFDKVVHPYAEVNNLELSLQGTDLAGNIHVTLKANVNFVNESGDLGGEFVWLANLKKFRGKVWCSLPFYSDTQLVMKARECFRLEHYSEAKNYLDAIIDHSDVPESAALLEEIVDHKLV